MYKNYAVLFQNTETKKVSNYTFYARSEREARHDFREVFRHGDYLILAVAEIPD